MLYGLVRLGGWGVIWAGKVGGWGVIWAGKDRRVGYYMGW